MGSKKKTYSDLAVNNMFDSGDNLWGHELARVAAAVNSMNPRYILPSVINDANQFYNEAVFDKMGVSANVSMSVAKLSKDGIGSYINQHIDPTIEFVHEWFYNDESDVDVDPTILQVLTFLDENYLPQHQYETTMFQVLNGDTYEVEYSDFRMDDGDDYVVRKRVYSDKEVPDVEIVNDIYGVWMSPLVDGEPDHDNAIHFMIPVDERAVMAVKYQTTSNQTRYIFVFADEVTASANSMTALVIPFYKNDVPVPDSRELDFILNRFGLGAEDKDGDTLKESMAGSDNLKHAFISYSLARDDDKFGHWVDFIYGKEDGKEEEECPYHNPYMAYNPLCKDTYNATTSRINISGEYNISYVMTSNVYSGGNQYYQVSVERQVKNADDGYFYIIPTEMLRRQTLPSKFEAYQRMFNMWAYSEKTVKLKWYQTTFFRIIIMIIGVVLSYFTGGLSLNMAIASLAVSVAIMVIAQINPELAAVLGVVLAIITFNPANIAGSLMNVANSLITAYSTFSTIAFQESMNSVKAETEKVNDETKDMKEMLSNMWHEGIYMPLDTMDNVFTMMSDGGETFNEMLYNQSDMIELAMENLTNPNARLT